MIKLYDYFRSSASYRVRIALNIKNLAYKKIEVNLVNNGGEQNHPEYKVKNPQGLIPTLIDEDFTITQSLAIIEYLEEKYPKPRIIPKDIEQKAYARQIANIVACDIHPINNLRVLNYLVDELKVAEDNKLKWYKNWITEGFVSIESILKTLGSKDFCIGDYPTIADICLIPQVYNAKRFDVNMQAFPIISQIEQNCLKLVSFAEASPEISMAS